MRRRGERGQGTVEFAVVFFGFLSLVIALGVVRGAFQDGLFVDHALQSASHSLESSAPGAVAGVLLY